MGRTQSDNERRKRRRVRKKYEDKEIIRTNKSEVAFKSLATQYWFA